jgi:uncharacterized protein YbjT (DUF2867 family)
VNVVVFGATGMIGGGVLIECLEAPAVRSVLAIGRRSCRTAHPKLSELIRSDIADLGEVTRELIGCDACFYCLGVSATGMSEAAYRRVTRDLTIAAAEALAAVNPSLTFCYVSGQGTDSSERGRFMWARVKGETENRLLNMSLPTYMFRPGIVQPLKGVRSSTRSYRILYALTAPLLPALQRLFPRHVTTTENVGRAMIRVALDGSEKRVLETSDINALAGR